MKYLLALIFVMFPVMSPAIADADVQVRIAADTYHTRVLAPNSYTVTVTSDSPANLSSVYFVLPGHGAPPLDGDEYGAPKLGRKDNDTSFVVTNSHGATVNNRIVTWSGPFNVSPSSPLSLRLDVITPAAAAWYFAGASATSSSPVSGTAKGADMEVIGSTDFTINTTVVQNGNQATYSASILNGTSHDFTVDRVKVGLTDGFEFVSTTFDHPVVDSNGNLINWFDNFVVPAHGSFEFKYTMKVPCGAGSRGVRTRAWLTEPLSTGQELAGTGPIARVKLMSC